MASKSQKRMNKPIDINRNRSRLNINIGIILFAVIFVYVFVCVVIALRTTHIAPYEVKEGSLATNYTYRGIAIRQETVVSSSQAGYINYYAREGERVAYGDLVYTVDGTGRLKEYLESVSTDENTLSDKELAELRSEIVTFVHDFDPTNYSTTYDFKYSIKGAVLKLANSGTIEGLTSLYGEEGLADLVDFCTATDTGIVTYWVDGYEDLTTAAISKNIFDESTYVKEQLINSELITQGDPVYKISTSENWSIVIPIEEEAFGQEMVDEEYVKVKFLKNQYESWAETALIYGSEGEPYLELKFNNSMVTFATDRYVDIELIVNDTVGLKIPNSSIATREFFLIPEECLTKGEDDKNGVIRESYKEDGSIISQFVEAEPYSYDETEKVYYIDTTVLNVGDNLIYPDSQQIFTVSRKGSLIGVYNMNKGYADFRQISILYQNDEYAIVKSNTTYGLNVYDYIVLDASSVDDEQFLY